MDKYTCNKHIDDYAIKKYIDDNSQYGVCNYCSKRRKVVEIDDLVDFMVGAVEYFYDDAANWLAYDSSEGGYLGTTYDTYDLLFDELELEINDAKLSDDILYAFPDSVWCVKDPYGNTESEELYYDWEDFKRMVKHKSRYSFYFIDKVKYGSLVVKVSDILGDITELIKKYKLIVPLPTTTAYIRCRQHEKSDEVKTAKDICSPPDEAVVFSNRMSPSGISMFYSAFDKEVAYKETIDLSNKRNGLHTIASFTSKGMIDVVDFSSVPELPSVFDIEKQKDYYSILFLKQFIHDLSKPIKRDGREHIEYVPTQIITEYLRYFFAKKLKLNVGGIIYPSAKVKNTKACVLFLNHEESLAQLTMNEFIVKDKINY